MGPQPMYDYQLTSKGRSAWTPDPQRAGYGNFCFGHRQVTTIDKVAARRQGGVTTAVVSYHYNLTDVPDWAKSDEIQTAFPDIKADLSGSSSSAANLEKGSDGWKVKPVS